MQVWIQAFHPWILNSLSPFENLAGEEIGDITHVAK